MSAGRTPQRRMARVLEDLAELKRLHPGATNAELAPRMGMTRSALERAIYRARERQRNGQPIPGAR